MRARFDREALQHAFQLVGAVVPSRSPKVILQNIKLSVEENRAVLIATDLEIVGIRHEVRGVKVEKPGEVILPTARFGSTIREMPDSEIVLDSKESVCVVTGQSAEIELPGDDPTLFPDVPKFEGESYHQIQAGVLKSMISRTVFAAAQENARYALTGVLWELEKEKARLVATDGRRLAIQPGIAVMHGDHTTEGQTPVVPTKSMTLLERHLHDADEQILVEIGPNEARFRTPRSEIYSRLVEGRYPPYEDVVPRQTKSKVNLKAEEFLGKVRLASVPTDEESRGVKFHFQKNVLTMEANVPERGRSKVELPIELHGEEVEITFNPAYLRDMLRVVESDAELTLELIDGNSAAVFRTDDDFCYVIMPLTQGNR